MLRQAALQPHTGLVVRRALPQFANPQGAFNCFLSVVLHIFWQSQAFVHWLLEAEAKRPDFFAGKASPSTNFR